MNPKLTQSSLDLIGIMDSLLRILDHKYKSEWEIEIIDDKKLIETWKYFPDSSYLNRLKDEGILEIRIERKDTHRDGKYIHTNHRFLSQINTLKLFEYKRRLLWKYQKSIINTKTLENISQFIWNSGNAQSIIEILKDCNIPEYLIIYPNTKWRMVYDIFKVLSTSIYEDGHKLLFWVIEEFLNPIKFRSIEEWMKQQEHFSEYLTYDGYEIKKWKILPIEDKRDMYDIFYESKTGERVEIADYDKIKDAISNTDYKKVTLIRWKDGQIESIDGERHITDSNAKFVDIKNAFPFSDIFASVHNKNVNKYTVTEKIKLNKNEQE